jgi:hypothetical protein
VGRWAHAESFHQPHTSKHGCVYLTFPKITLEIDLNSVQRFWLNHIHHSQGWGVSSFLKKSYQGKNVWLPCYGSFRFFVLFSLPDTPLFGNHG